MGTCSLEQDVIMQKTQQKTKKRKTKDCKFSREKTADEDKNDATMIPPLPTLQGVDDNDSLMGSSDRIYDTKQYYSFNQSMEVMTSDPSS